MIALSKLEKLTRSIDTLLNITFPSQQIEVSNKV